MTDDEIAVYRARLRASCVPEEDHEEFIEDEMQRRAAADPAAALRTAIREALTAIVADARGRAE